MYFQQERIVGRLAFIVHRRCHQSGAHSPHVRGVQQQHSTIIPIGRLRRGAVLFLDARQCGVEKHALLIQIVVGEQPRDLMTARRHLLLIMRGRNCCRSCGDRSRQQIEDAAGVFEAELRQPVRTVAIPHALPQSPAVPVEGRRTHPNMQRFRTVAAPTIAAKKTKIWLDRLYHPQHGAQRCLGRSCLQERRELGVDGNRRCQKLVQRARRLPLQLLFVLLSGGGVRFFFVRSTAPATRSTSAPWRATRLQLPLACLPRRLRAFVAREPL
mmetsp:Transcript_21593/g.54531  ORF Transcript_21593/g.54531 Transcript_21593/m.54531 type:complete len:270 (+) Transcript_21593:199-1008(+)